MKNKNICVNCEKKCKICKWGIAWINDKRKYVDISFKKKK
jgi:hypothetical protein